MRRSVAELRGAAVQELTHAGPAVAAVLVDGVPALDEDLEAEGAGEAKDPTAKRHPKRPASAWTAALRAPGDRGRRARLAAAAAVFSALLLVLWAAQPAGTPLAAGGGGRPGGRQLPRAAGSFIQQQQQPDKPPFELPGTGDAAQDQPQPLAFERGRQQAGDPLSEQQQQAEVLHVDQPSASTKAVPQELLVKFTAPGLRIPLR